MNIARMDKRDIVVIGGSSGSTPVLARLLAGLPGDFGGAVFITTHVAPNSPRMLAPYLARTSRLPVRYPKDGEPLERGQVYLAPPDRHLLLVDGGIRHGFGPRENMARPSIDALFRSAALAHGPRVAAVLLSGMLDDGVAGLLAVRRHGGLVVVQAPESAEAPEMPAAALNTLDPDHVAPPDALADVIVAIAGEAAPAPAEREDDNLRLEVEIALGSRLGSERLERVADPAPQSCPQCKGVLSQMRSERPLRFRCQTGHAFTAGTLIDAQEAGVEEALRIALRMVEERVDLVDRMARTARENGRRATAELYETRRQEFGAYADTLRKAAIAMMKFSDPVED